MYECNRNIGPIYLFIAISLLFLHPIVSFLPCPKALLYLPEPLLLWDLKDHVTFITFVVSYLVRHILFTSSVGNQGHPSWTLWMKGESLPPHLPFMCYDRVGLLTLLVRLHALEPVDLHHGHARVFFHSRLEGCSHVLSAYPSCYQFISLLVTEIMDVLMKNMK